MKDPFQRTKVVIRHLPPSLSQNDTLALFNDRFNDRYNWFCFRPGKSSHKHQRYSRAYVELKKPEYVFEFAELLNDHMFVNEKGAQFKAIVEYAPSQRVPKSCAKKDSREGSIYRDPDYLEFLKLIAKPVENLPSAEIQLERKEAELAGAPKETLVITPLMEYIRQKRAAESGTQGSLTVGRVGRRSRATSASKSGSSTTKRGSEKKKYIPKDRTKNASQKAKSTFILATKREDQPALSSGKEISESGANTLSGITLTSETGKKKFLLLKGKEREIPHETNALLHKQRDTSPVENSTTATVPKQVQRHEAGGRLTRKILLNNEARQTQSLTGGLPLQKMQTLNLENGKPLPGSISSANGHASNNDLPVSNSDGDTNRTLNDRFARKVLHGSGVASEKQEKHTRNKDRPDRGVWTPLHRSDVSHANVGRLSSSQPAQLHSTSVDVTHREIKDDSSYGSKTVEVEGPAGSHRHNGRRVPAHIMKDDGSINTVEGKSSKRRGASGSGGNEKQVWIQKSSSGH